MQMISNSYQGFKYQRVIDWLCSIVIIGFLAVIAIGSYELPIYKARVLHAFAGGQFLEAKKDAMIYHAFTGEWPQSGSEVMAFANKQYDPESNHEYKSEYDGGFIEKAVISESTIDCYFGPTLSGGILSIRPAVPVDDDLGPVRWGYGTENIINGWKVSGRNNSTINEDYIINISRF